MTAMQGQGAPQMYAAPPLAGWGSRAGGYIVDAIISGVPYAILLAVGETITTVLGALIAIGLTAYNRWFMAGKTGQSWGRKAVGVRLIGAETGQPIGAGMAFVRDIAHIVDNVICYIGWLFPLWDAKKQTIADKIVKTVVVKG